MKKIYRNIKTNEILFKEDSAEYSLDNLGLCINPKGKNGEFTSEQIEIVEEIKDWYLKKDWIEEEIENE